MEDYDYGWDLDDVREEYIDDEGQDISLVIERVWYHRDDCEYCDEEMDFYCLWSIKVDGKTVLTFPRGKDEDEARAAMEKLYPRDEKASHDLEESLSIERVERRMGA